MTALLAPSIPRLILTGERVRRRHLVRVDGRPVWIPGGLFTTLCALVRARCSTQTGFVVESPLTIFRLRALLDLPSGQRSGRSIIETGDGHEYRIVFASASVEVDPSFAELPSPGLIDRDVMLALLSLAGRPRMQPV